MEIDWEPGPPTEPGNYYVQLSNLDVCPASVSPNCVLSLFSKKAVRHFGPIPEVPTAEPKLLKPFRSFRLVAPDGLVGMGTYDPNETRKVHPYIVHWTGEIWRNEWSDSAWETFVKEVGCTFEWLDEES